jgi:hypothetical protein
MKKPKREAKEIKLIEETTHRDEIEKIKHGAQDMRQIQETIDQYKMEKTRRQTETVTRELELHKRINQTLDRQLEIIKYTNELERQINEIKCRQMREVAEKERQKLELEFASSIKRSRNVFTLCDYFYDSEVSGDLQSFDINVAFKDNNYFNDSILNYIEHYSNQFSSYPKLNEEEIQKGFDQFILNLLNTSNNFTSLKYLNASSSYYLENKFNPNCTFMYKNINIDMDQEEPCFTRFRCLSW